MRRLLKSKKAEGYIDVAVTIMLVAFVLVFAVNMVSLVALNQNVKTVADQLVDYAAQQGIQWGFVRDMNEELFINNTEYVDEMTDPNWRSLSEEF